MKKIYLMLCDHGGGHRITAQALQKAIKQRNLPWQVEMVEIYQEILGISTPEYLYNNLVLKKRWSRLINNLILVPLFKLEIRLHQVVWRNYLMKYWREHQPDLVISLVPHLNRLLYESLQSKTSETPFITLPIDLVDSPPHFWIEPQEQFLICPTPRMVKQAQQLGCRQEQIVRTSGVVINPRFYEPIAVDRRVERQSLGLEPDLPTGLIMFGAYGSEEMIKIARCLGRSQQRVQLIFICGRDEKIANVLRASQINLPILVEGFTDQIPYYMYLSDFFIGKPGPGALSEALAMKLPVITDCNALTLFQERYNSEWIRNQGVGIVVRDFQQIDQAVTELLKPENFARYRAKSFALNNQAVFEVVDFFERILAFDINLDGNGGLI
jgi:1,2-diacylglycerol 3-beta-galactosyltransferase